MMLEGDWGSDIQLSEQASLIPVRPLEMVCEKTASGWLTLCRT